MVDGRARKSLAHLLLCMQSKVARYHIMDKRTLRQIGWVSTTLSLTTLLVGCGEIADDSAPGEPASQGASLAVTNGLSMINGLSFANGLAAVNGLASSNGLSLTNGLASTNGLA